jgi:hypothetical protein
VTDKSIEITVTGRMASPDFLPGGCNPVGLIFVIGHRKRDTMDTEWYTLDQIPARNLTGSNAANLEKRKLLRHWLTPISGGYFPSFSTWSGAGTMWRISSRKFL